MNSPNQGSNSPGPEQDPAANGPGTTGNTTSDLRDSTPTHISNSSNETPSDASGRETSTPAPTPSGASEGTAAPFANFFDRIMDTLLQRNRSLSNAASPIGGSPASAGIPNTTTTTTTTTGTGTGTSTGGAIIITVDYVFSDENNPTNPNRTGSLVISMPNNASNRDPRVIQEFIRLATQMAHSSIVSGLHKPRGITVEKFNSFPIKDPLELAGNTDCSICFEHFETLNRKKRSAPEDDDSDTSYDDENAMKRRKANDTAAINSDNTAATENPRRLSVPDPNYLAGCKMAFLHVPVQMPCGHIFGKSCLYEWLKSNSSCPLCRHSVAENGPPTYLPAAIPQTTATTTTTTPNVFDSASTRPPLLDSLTAPLTSFTQMPPNARVNRPSRYRGLVSGNGEGSFLNILRNDHIAELVNAGTQAQGSRSSPSTLPGVLALLSRSGPEQDLIFPAGVSSRRTSSGVETRSTENADHEVLDFLHLRSLVDDDLAAAAPSSSGSPAAADAPSNPDAQDSSPAHSNTRD